VTRRISNRRRAAPRTPDECEPIEAERVDDRLEVANERIDREYGVFPVRKTVTPLVIVNEGVVTRELFGPVTPYRVFPIEGKMTEPVRRPDQWWAIADAGVGDPAIIRGPAKLHLMQGRASGRSLPRGQSGGSIIQARRRVGLKGQLRCLPQRAVAHHVELFQPSLCALKLFFGLAPAAGGTQQSN
jgi:hypothetical protein